MALKRPFPQLEVFSMASMTDIIFLLLIFFMVTSTVIFPAAVDVNLPQSEQQTTLKPQTEVYIDSLRQMYIVENRLDSLNPDAAKALPVDELELEQRLLAIHAADSTRSVALYADENIEYGRVIRLLDMAARNKLRMVLATRPTSAPTDPQQSTPTTQP